MLFQTSRLRLRPLTYEDSPFLIELLNDPAWLQNIGDRHVHTEADARAYLDRTYLKMYREHGFGMWLCERLSDGTAVGSCGIVKRDELPCPDLGFAFLEAYRGKGYAHEAAQACLKIARDDYGADRLRAIVLPTNQPSIRLLRKLEFKKIGTFQFPDDSDILDVMERYL